MEITQEQKLYQEVIQKAWEDAEFKKELTQNPLDAIEKLTGVRLNLPERKTIVVRDQTDESTVYINIPAKQKMDDVELNEEQLEAVAGGRNDIPFIDIIFPSFPPKGCFPTDDITF
ncbi:MAG: NHLP leader peptide family RiPP precursor [Tenacibaculum sp.]